MAETDANRTKEDAGRGDPANGRTTSAMAWMLGLSVALFWLPVLGMFIAGLVGGRKAGTVMGALGAALLPAAIVGLAMFLGAALFLGMPILGLLAGFGASALVVANVVPMLLGAILGGLLA